MSGTSPYSGNYDGTSTKSPGGPVRTPTAPRSQAGGCVGIIISLLLAAALVATIEGVDLLGMVGIDLSFGAITSPRESDSKALLETAQSSSGFKDPLVIERVFVQGGRAAGILAFKDNAKARYVFVWVRSGGTWSVTYQANVGPQSKAAIREAGLGLTEEIIDRLGL